MPNTDIPFDVRFTHRLRFVADALDIAEPALADAIRAGDGVLPARVLAVIDDGLLRDWPALPERLTQYACANADVMQLMGPVRIMPGGERAKNDRAVFDRVCGWIFEAGLCRQSYVLAIGGGAVLDVVGFAAAVAHRGIRLIRVPTTTLAQADSGVGVKCGINAFGRKNYLGAFAPPWAVINDEHLPASLPDDQWRSGFAEIVKVGLVKDAALFHDTAAAAARLRQRDMATAMPLIRRSALIHLQHITGGGDPFELTAARPLDFGHWSAHKLEQQTDFQLPHGQAVSVGVALDATYSTLAGLLPASAMEAALAALRGLGLPTFHPYLTRTTELFCGFDEFREHLGGRFTLTLLRGIGDSVDVHEINHDLVLRAIERLNHP